jgi:short-subunit dehydrogenase
MRLTQALLPGLKAQPQAAIVNIGSTFGSLPFAGFAAYSAAKAGLRGFSQALRRELADTQVAVIHLAPRAIDTALNTEAVNALNRALNNNSDSTETVARQVVAALRRGDGEHHFGFPERLFAWINGFAPSLIDRGLAGKLAVIKQHAPSR